MAVKDVFKNISALFGLLTAGVSGGFASTAYLIETMPLMDQSAVPENPVAVIILPFLSAAFSIFVVIVFAVLIFALNRKVRLELLVFRKGERKVCYVFRGIGYLVIIRLIYEAVRDWITFGRFFTTGLWFYTSGVVFVILGLMIFIAIISKDETASGL